MTPTPSKTPLPRGRPASARPIRGKARPGRVLAAPAGLLACCLFLPAAPAAFADAPAAAPAPKGTAAGTNAPAGPEQEPQVIELMYYTTDANGRSVGIPGPDDDLVQIIRHRNGKLWPGQKIDFDITTGSRLISLSKGVPPYVRHLTVYSDEHGVARVYLQPLP